MNASDNIVLKEMNKIGLCVVFMAIAVLMGTCFFAVNEQWTAAESFYWTIMTMTVSTNSFYFHCPCILKVLALTRKLILKFSLMHNLFKLFTPQTVGYGDLKIKHRSTRSVVLTELNNQK